MNSVIQRSFFVGVAATLFLTTILVIPRPLYRKYLIYGLLLGAIPDLLIVGLFGRVLHWFTWTNIGPSDVFGWNATVPLTFAFWTMLFLYFLPLRTAYLIPYFVLFTAISVGMGQVTRNLGLFTYRPWYIYLMPFVFLAWYSGISWAFRWQERVIAERPVQ